MNIDAALARFGLAAFRPGQREVIEAVLAGRPTIAVLPTGAGKSLCYQLPATALGGLAVVVSPLISLMKDQVDALTARGIPAAFINSSVDPEEREARLAEAVRGELRLLYVAPERFRVAGFVSELSRARVELMAIDEAHCITEWGHDFRPDYARLGEVLRTLAPPRVVALTATATPEVREQIRARLGMVEPAVFVRGFDRPNLRFEVVPVRGAADKLGRCVALLEEPEARAGSAIVYTATRKRAEEVARSLSARGIAAVPYHAGLDDQARAEAQEAWMSARSSGGPRVVVATNAFGMGVDKRDVRLVIHHDLPGSLEAYYQEAGRAGRDGLAARCVLLFHHGDVRLREFLIAQPGESGPKPEALVAADQARLRAMMGYAYARRCRRACLLDHFGDPEAGAGCSGCDVCDERSGAAEPLDPERTLIVRKALATVARLDGWFGRQRIALVLEGSTAKEVTSARLDQLGTFGTLRGRPHAFVLDLLGALEAAGLIVPSGGDYPTLSLTPLGREVMHARHPAAISWPREPIPRRARAARAVDEAMTGDDEPMFQRLRGLRAKLAQEAHLPAYCVFHDRTLAELARARPSTLDALSRIPGVGPSKLAKYGQQLLDAIAGG